MDVDCVLVGRDAQRTLARAVASVRGTVYNKGRVNVFYADLGSSDKSVPEALDIEGVTVLEFDRPDPGPAGAVNAAVRAGTAPLVQIMRADSIMAPEWLDTALASLESGRGVLFGERKRLAEPSNSFDSIADSLRNPPAGFMLDFEEEALIRRKCLEQAGPMDQDMALGWEAEFCSRARKRGWDVVRVDAAMAGELGIPSLSAGTYLAGVYRRRLALVLAALRHFGDKALVRSSLGPAWRGGAGMCLAAAGLAGAATASATLSIALPLAALVLFYPRVWRWGDIMDEADADEQRGKLLAWHACAEGPAAFLALARALAGILVRFPPRNRPGRPPLRGLP